MLGGRMDVTGLSTRLATPADAAAIAAIYNEGIAERIAIFETEPRTAEQIATQLLDKGDRFPTVVAEHEGRIVAWAGAARYLALRHRRAAAGGRRADGDGRAALRRGRAQTGRSA